MYLAACRERFDLVLLGPRRTVKGTVAALLPAVAGRDAPAGTVLAETDTARPCPSLLRHADAEKTIQIRHSGAGRYEADAEF